MTQACCGTLDLGDGESIAGAVKEPIDACRADECQRRLGERPSNWTSNTNHGERSVRRLGNLMRFTTGFN